jgi:hypothetical protein
VIVDKQPLLSASALQDEKNDQRYNKKNSNLGSRSAKGRGKSSARAILVITAAPAFPVSSIHDGLFER